MNVCCPSSGLYGLQKVKSFGILQTKCRNLLTLTINYSISEMNAGVRHQFDRVSLNTSLSALSILWLSASGSFLGIIVSCLFVQTFSSLLTCLTYNLNNNQLGSLSTPHSHFKGILPPPSVSCSQTNIHSLETSLPPPPNLYSNLFFSRYPPLFLQSSSSAISSYLSEHHVSSITLYSSLSFTICWTSFPNLTLISRY